VRGDITPFVLRDQLHSAYLYFAGACFALAAEMSLAGWVFQRLEVVWWYGSSAAFLIAGIIGAGLHLLAEDPDRPKHTQFMVKRYAAFPGFMLLLLAIVLAVLARYVYGWAVLVLLPVFGLALWMGTITLMVFSAALFANAYLLSWSLQETKKFDSLDQEVRLTEAFMKELDGGQPPAAPMEPPPVSPGDSPEGPRPTLRGKNVPPPTIILLLALSLSLAVGCSPAPSHAETSDFGSARLAASEDSTEVELDLVLDCTGSPIDQAVKETWARLKREVPKTIEDHQVTHLTVSAFEGDGWSLTTLWETELPRFGMTDPHRETVGEAEWKDFGNVKDALKDDDDKRHSGALDKHRSQLRDALRPLESLRVLPEEGQEAKGSDIVGLLEHISHAGKPLALFIVVSDFADTHYKGEFPKIAAPPSGISVVALVVPAKRKDNIMTLGSDHSGAQQFDIRSGRLQRSAPWVTAVPYFAGNISSLLKAQK